MIFLFQDQNATRIKMQHGSRFNEDQYATRIKMLPPFQMDIFVSFMVCLAVCCVSYMCCFQLQYDVKQRGNYKILIK